MVAQPAEASVGGGEQANEKQGRKQHRGRGGHGREKRDNSVIAAAAGGTGGEAPRAVPVPPQPQLAATTTGARRRGGGQAGRATTAAVHELVAGVTSLSVDPAAKTLPKPRPVAPSVRTFGDGSSQPSREPPVNGHNAAADIATQQPPPKAPPQAPAPAPKPAYEARPSRPRARYVPTGPRFVVATQSGVSFQDDLGSGAGGYADREEGQGQMYGQGVHEQQQQQQQQNYGHMGHSRDTEGQGQMYGQQEQYSQMTHQQHQDEVAASAAWGQHGGLADQVPGRGASPPMGSVMLPPPGEGYEYGAPFGAAQMTPPPATHAAGRSYAPLPLLPNSPFMPTPQPQPPQPPMGSHGHYVGGLPAVLFPNQGYAGYPTDGGWGMAQQQHLQFMAPPQPQQHPWGNAQGASMGYGAPGMYGF